MTLFAVKVKPLRHGNNCLWPLMVKAIASCGEIAEACSLSS